VREKPLNWLAGFLSHRRRKLSPFSGGMRQRDDRYGAAILPLIADETCLYWVSIW
jgi:hypothetical protein